MPQAISRAAVGQAWAGARSHAQRMASATIGQLARNSAASPMTIGTRFDRRTLARPFLLLAAISETGRR